MHGGRQHDLGAQHRGQRERCHVRVVLVDETRARDIAQQQPQPPPDPALHSRSSGLRSCVGMVFELKEACPRPRHQPQPQKMFKMNI